MDLSKQKEFLELICQLLLNSGLASTPNEIITLEVFAISDYTLELSVKVETSNRLQSRFMTFYIGVINAQGILENIWVDDTDRVILTQIVNAILESNSNNLIMDLTNVR